MEIKLEELNLNIKQICEQLDRGVYRGEELPSINILKTLVDNVYDRDTIVDSVFRYADKTTISEYRKFYLKTLKILNSVESNKSSRSCLNFATILVYLLVSDISESESYSELLDMESDYVVNLSNNFLEITGDLDSIK